MMNTQSAEAPTIKRFNWIAMLMLLLCCAMVSDVNIQIVIAQEAAPASASAPDDGASPSPEVAVATEPAAPATPAPIAVDVAQSASAASPTDEPAPASEVASQDELNAIPAASESISDIVSSVNDAVRNLSVEPGSRPLLPKDRPSWVGAPADLSTKNHMLSVGSIPMLHQREVDSALDEALLAAVHTYINEHVVNQFGAAEGMPIDVRYIRKHLIDDSNGYVCELSTSEGPLYQKWVRVRITPEQRDKFQQWHTEDIQRDRVGPLGIILASTFLLVGLSHMVLRSWHGVTSLPLVNQSIPSEQVVANPKRGLMLPTLFVMGALLLFGLGLVGMFTSKMQPAQYPQTVEMQMEHWPVVPGAPGVSVPQVRVQAPRMPVTTMEHWPVVPDAPRVSVPRARVQAPQIDVTGPEVPLSAPR